MSKTISATEAKNRFGAVMSWVLQNEEEVIIESRGKPQAVVMGFRDYQETKKVKDHLRRQEALTRLENLRDKVAVRNRDLNEEQALDLTDRFSREVIEEMAQEKKPRHRSRP